VVEAESLHVWEVLCQQGSIISIVIIWMAAGKTRERRAPVKCTQFATKRLHIQIV
jgi:hypothetical protein